MENNETGASVEQFDWNYLNSLSVDYLEEFEDSEAIENVICSFVDSRFGKVERQLFVHPLSVKLYRILQICLRFMIKKQQKLGSECKGKSKEIHEMQRKLEKTITKLEEISISRVSSHTIVFCCPVCQKAFKSMMHQDKHIEKHHPEHLEAWVSMRQNKSYGAKRNIEELQKEIDEIRASVVKQNIKSVTKKRKEEIVSNGKLSAFVVDPKGNIDDLPGSAQFSSFIFEE